MNSVTLRTLCLLLFATPASAQVAIPDTPAGENLSAMLDALNSGDRDVIVQYVDRYWGGSGDDIVQAMQQLGSLSLTRIVKSERLRVQFLVRSEALDVRLLAMLEVEDADPPRVVISLPWVPIPAGAVVIGFDVDSDTRSRVIRDLAAKLAENYVLPDEALRMADVLVEKHEGGGYDHVTNGWALANVLTEDLRAVNEDKHLVVRFSPMDHGPPMPGAFPPQLFPGNVGDCGFEHPEIVEDGIGYVKINRFVNPNTCAAEAVEALTLLRSTSALVFDLRDAVGGHAGMVTLIVAHLFDAPPRLSSVHRRQPPGVDELRLPETDFSLAEKPVYVLTSERTFSAAEWFAYDLQALHRATIVGETTAGGAHPARPERVDERFGINLPYARAVNPITERNWEGTGVIPDVSVHEAESLNVALELIREAEEP